METDYALEEDGAESGDLEAAIAASRLRAEAKSVQELQLELDAVRLRLLRRSQIIDAIRKAYIRDVVMIKDELMRKATITDEVYFSQGGPGTEVTDAIPSLDMRPVLSLFSPEDAFLRVESCSACGGHLEIVTRETKRVARLAKRISVMTTQMDENAKVTAQLKAELLLTRQRVKELDERNIVNRDTLVAKLESTQRTCAAEVVTLKEDARRQDIVWQAKLARKEEDLEAVPVLQREGERLRLALKAEQAGREDDLQDKDGHIAAFKTQVDNLLSSAEDSAKRLVDMSNTCDDIQLRLKVEKAEHSATRELLEEERTRYERCRTSLEVTQEHLADLNDRFNDLRIETETAAETAQDEAGEASDALASAKSEIKRLRAVMGASDVAVALDEATAKVSKLSEELDVRRAEAREAQNALKEARERVQGLQAQAVEKWVALVRFRKAVSAHNAEVARLKRLLMQAQVPEDRVRLTSQLEEVANSGDLDDMEDEMHKEVAALKQRASGSSHGSPGDVGETSEAEMLGRAREQEVQQSKLERKIEQLKMEHQETVEALRSELSSCRDRIQMMEEEAERIREQLKRLEKLEKREKGNSVMKEEIKKMEEETGLSVGFNSSLEFESVEGDLSREDEARLIEELDRAKQEIKNMKNRQAMVTHELLGKLKGASAEIEMLRIQLDKVTQERDARVDLSTVQGLGKGFFGDEAEEFENLKEESKRHKKVKEALQRGIKESSDAMQTLLRDLSRACKDTQSAKAKVWNQRDLDRARSIPPPAPPTMSLKGAGKVSTALKRLSAAGEARRSSAVSSRDFSDRASGPRVSMGARSPATVLDAKDKANAGDRGAELERRRAEREALVVAMEQQAVANEKETQDLAEACAAPLTEGMDFAAERLATLQAAVKEQFRGVFVELKEALAMHKKFVLRSRVEARDRIAREASLEAEQNRLVSVVAATEEELRGRSTVLRQTELSLHSEKDLVEDLQRKLEAARKEARDNIFFKEKNAILQKQVDRADISSRGARQEAAKAKWEVQEQASNMAELRRRAEESARRDEHSRAIEADLKGKIAELEGRLVKSQDKLDELEQWHTRRLGTLAVVSTQVNGYEDPELGLGQAVSVQTTFHCPQLTLRQRNVKALSATRAFSAGTSECGRHRCSAYLAREGVRTEAIVETVYAAVDGAAEAADRDPYRPGAGTAALMDMQSWISSPVSDINGHEAAHKLACAGGLPPFNMVGSYGSNDVRWRKSGVLDTPQSTGASQAQEWGLWNEGDPEASRNAAVGERLDEEPKPHDRRQMSIPCGDQSALDPPKAREHVSRQRGKTTETLVGWGHPAMPNSGGAGGGEGSSRPRMRSRVFLQSADYHSSCLNGGRDRENARCLRERPSQTSFVRASFCSGDVLAKPRPKTSAGMVTRAMIRQQERQERFPKANAVVGGRPVSVQAEERSCSGERPTRPIDIGVLSEVPRPRVWNDQHMAVAAAAASGRSIRAIAKASGLGGRITDVTKGGVIVDTRFADIRKSLREDLLDAAERARLPLLQQ